jgi:murein DD-endopeptidase MepM/ murein hydrolase activator NlpD
MKANKNILNILCALLLIIASGRSYAEYSLDKTVPVDYSQGKLIENEYITHNYGEYRGSSSYKYHDGIDYKIFDKTNHSEIYPVSPGIAHVYPDNGGWGNCVVVDHGTFQTRYAHLSSIEATEGQRVETTTVLGLSGNTGASDGEHLHFSIGSNVDPVNTINPILAGLKQPKYGEIKKVACPKGFEIRLLATGTDGTFGGTNDVILSDANETINSINERGC